MPDEPPLVPARLHAMDGNSSAKHLDGAGHTDPRTFKSQYLIPPVDVDQFTDDGVARTRASKSGQVTGNSTPTTAGPASQASLKSSPTDLGAGCNHFAAANAQSEEKKSVFDINGPFISACRHGFVETLIEMRRSGEL